MGHPIRPAVCLAIAVAAFGYPAAAGKLGQGDAQAKALRQQALALRMSADQARQEAYEDRGNASAASTKAGQLRDQSAQAKAAGNDSQADVLNQQAVDSDNSAALLKAAAEGLDQKASQLEAAASEKEAEARQLEATSQSAADQLYRQLRESIGKAQADLSDLKQHQTETRVGRQAMTVRLLFSHVHDEELKPFGQADLDQLFAPYESQFRRFAGYVEEDRDNLASGTFDADSFCRRTYANFKSVVLELEDAEFSLVAKGFDTYEADIYKVERQLNAEWKAEQDALATSNETSQQKQADLDALSQKQSGERKDAFYDVAKRYRIEKNRLALYRQDWVDQVTSWHDLGSKLSTGDDVHRAGTLTMDNLVRGWFSKDETNQPQSLALFAFTPGSPDRFTTGYDDYDWCKARPFPDVEAEDAPGLLRMQSILDKLPLLIRSGKSDGAAKNSGARP